MSKENQIWRYGKTGMVTIRFKKELSAKRADIQLLALFHEKMKNLNVAVYENTVEAKSPVGLFLKKLCKK